MSEEEFDEAVDKNFDEVIMMVMDDYEFIEDMLQDNANSGAVFDWAHEHQDKVLEQLGLDNA